MEPLGEVFNTSEDERDGKSWSKLKVRVVGEYLFISNIPEARDCRRKHHNRNIMDNIDTVLENEYLVQRRNEYGRESSQAV